MKLFSLKENVAKFKAFLRWIVKTYKDFKSYLKSTVIKVYPGKETLNLEKFILYSATAFLILAVLSSLLFSPEEERSLYSRVTGLSESEKDPIDESKTTKSDRPLKGSRRRKKGRRLSGDSSNSDAESKKSKKSFEIKYGGTQVFIRKVDQGGKALPLGTHFIGRLLTDVDTRAPDNLIRVALPFGAKFKGRRGLPPKTLLLGKATYSGRGKRLFLKFNMGVLPNGEEFKLKAQAMDSRDFSIGLLGKYHSAFKNRAGATLGFAFLSGASEVMQEKEALGQGHTLSKKASFENAMLGGLSEFSNTEGALQLQEVQGRGAYVTLSRGKELIVTLTETFNRGGSR